jgi:hypothetical protein
MVVVLVGVAVAHDVIVCRSEFDPFIALCKARWAAPEHVAGYDEVIPTVNGVVEDDNRVNDLGDGVYEVRFHVVCRQKSSQSLPMPLRCTILCGGLDIWTLQDYQLGDGPVVRCDYELSPTGQVNRLWLFRYV